MCIETKRNLKIMHAIMRATGKYLQVLMGPAISKETFKSTNTRNHLTHLAMESSKIFPSFQYHKRRVCHVHLFIMR